MKHCPNILAPNISSPGLACCLLAGKADVQFTLDCTILILLQTFARFNSSLLFLLEAPLLPVELLDNYHNCHTKLMFVSMVNMGPRSQAEVWSWRKMLSWLTLNWCGRVCHHHILSITKTMITTVFENYLLSIQIVYVLLWCLFRKMGDTPKIEIEAACISKPVPRWLYSPLVPLLILAKVAEPWHCRCSLGFSWILSKAKLGDLVWVSRQWRIKLAKSSFACSP